MSILTLWKRFASKSPMVLDLANGRDDFGKRVREVHGGARLEAGSEITGWMSGRALRRLEMVRADALGDLENARGLFFKNRIDFVVMPSDEKMAAFLRYHQFHIFAGSGEKPVHIPDGQVLPRERELLAMHQRFTTPVVQGPGTTGGMHIDIPALFRQHGIAARGVIHIGAHFGEELDLYRAMGFQKVLFIEANPTVYQRLAQRLQGQQNVFAVLCAISDKNGMVTLHVTSNDEASSILTLKKHAELYPEIKETAQVLTPARKLDHLLIEIGQNPADYNFLHLDIQGAELKALMGATDTLPGIDAISTEVNYEELYEGCPLVEDLDDFLEQYKFKRYFTATPAHPEWGDAFYLRNPRVSMRMLGRWGRFGNQFFEYAFTKIFGRTHDLEVQTSPWIGQQLFGASDPIVREELRQYQEVTYAVADSQVAYLKARQANIDLRGVFQYHTAYFAPHRAYFRSLFQPVPALRKVLDAGMEKIRSRGKSLVVLHLRRGDYGYGMFFIPPISWYLDWLELFWPTLESPVLYIATDEPDKVGGEFAKYSPLFAVDLSLPAMGADYYPDFYMISQADAAAISNSTYSFAACMLNEKGKLFLRPDLYAGKLVNFDPWNEEPLLHRELGMIKESDLRHVLMLYGQNPKDESVLLQLRRWRVELAESWSQIDATKLPIVARRDLWSCTKAIREANLRSLPAIQGEPEVIARVKKKLEISQGADAIGPWIGMTLFLPRSLLPAVDMAGLPGDVREALEQLS